MASSFDYLYLGVLILGQTLSDLGVQAMRKRQKKGISDDRTELPNGHDHAKGPDCDADFETLRAIALPVTEEFMKRIADLVSDVEVRLNKPLKPEDD
jgi:hypothetical protein